MIRVKEGGSVLGPPFHSCVYLPFGGNQIKQKNIILLLWSCIEKKGNRRKCEIKLVLEKHFSGKFSKSVGGVIVLLTLKC